MKNYHYYNQIAKYLSGESTAEEKASLNAWLNDAPSNRKVFDEISRNWSALQREGSPKALARGKAQVFGRIADAKVSQQAQQGKPEISRRHFYRSLLQGIAALLVIASVWYLNPGKILTQPVAGLKKVANVGKPKEVFLPDGSRVWLNTDSHIRYVDDFLGNSREVYLEGEAYFEVERDESKPFIVHAGLLSTRVLGTSFNVRAYPQQNDIEVTVTSGKVSVVDSTGVIGELIKNQQIAYQKASGRSTRQLVVASEAQEWKDGRLLFEALSYKAAAKILEQRFHVSIAFDNIAIQNCPVTAQFDDHETLEQILKMLGMVTASEHQFLDQQHIVIKGRGCPSPES